jgi:hypothetical protein
VNAYVLGAPGSGKTALVGPLRARLPGHLVVDWDFLMEPAGQLAGRSIQANRSTWSHYDALVRAVLDQLGVPLVLLGVRTPEELHGWPFGTWILLDCADETRVARLGERRNGAELAEAVEDGRRYRELGLPVVDSTSLAIEDVAEELVSLLTRPGSHATQPQG